MNKELSTLKLLREGYGFIVKRIQYYHLRLEHEASDKRWDWYCTTGTLVESEVYNYRRIFKNIGRFRNDEDMAIFIKKRIYKN